MKLLSRFFLWLIRCRRKQPCPCKFEGVEWGVDDRPLRFRFSDATQRLEIVPVEWKEPGPDYEI